MVLKKFSEAIKKKIKSGIYEKSCYEKICTDYKLGLPCGTVPCNLLDEIKKTIFFFIGDYKRRDIFYAGLAHDIKSPMMSIEIALRNSLNSEIISDVYYTNVANLNLINNVLELYSSKAKIKLIEFDFMEILDMILRSYKYLLMEKNIRIELSSKNEILLITSCPICVGRIIANLLSNAIKFSPMGKNIKIKIDKNSVSFSNTKSSKNNIPQASNGLGLNISKLLSKKIGGRIFKKSLNKNITYIFEFKSPIKQRSLR